MNEIRKIAQKLKNLHFHVSNNLREERLLTTIIHLCNKANIKCKMNLSFFPIRIQVTIKQQ
jgi:hypothetical protein